MSVEIQALGFLLVFAVSLGLSLPTWGLTLPARSFWPWFAGWALVVLLLNYANSAELQAIPFHFAIGLIIGFPLCRFFFEVSREIVRVRLSGNAEFRSKTEEDLKKNLSLETRSVLNANWNLAQRVAKFSWAQGIYFCISLSDGGAWRLSKTRESLFPVATNLDAGSSITLKKANETERKKFWAYGNREVNVFVAEVLLWTINCGRNHAFLESNTYKVDDHKEGVTLCFQGNNWAYFQGSPRALLSCDQENVVIGDRTIQFTEPKYETLAVAMVIYLHYYD